MYLGGSVKSSESFLALGNVYFLDGLAGVVVFYVTWAGVAAWLLARSRSGPIPLCLFGIVVSGPLSWLATYPDMMVGALQHVVAALPVLFILWVSRVPAQPVAADVDRTARWSRRMISS
jgi:hypothetical protein